MIVNNGGNEMSKKAKIWVLILLALILIVELIALYRNGWREEMPHYLFVLCGLTIGEVLRYRKYFMQNGGYGKALLAISVAVLSAEAVFVIAGAFAYMSVSALAVAALYIPIFAAIVLIPSEMGGTDDTRRD